MSTSHDCHDIEVYGNEISNSEKVGVGIGGWNVAVDDNIIQNTEDQGIDVSDNAHDVTISENVIQETSHGVNVQQSGDIHINGNEVIKNETGVTVEESEGIRINDTVISDNETGVWVDGVSTEIDATINWWGANSGPSGDGPGTGDSVHGNVEFEPWLAPEATLTDSEISAVELTDGETITISAVIENTGTYPGELTLELFVDGEVVETVELQLEIGETSEVEFDHPFEASGEYEIHLNDDFVGDVSVQREEDVEADTDREDTDLDDDAPMDDTMEDALPGFGIGSVVVGIGAAAYLVKRRLKRAEE